MAKRELVVEMLLNDGEMRTRNAARGRQNANSCSQDRQALLEDLVVAE